MLITLISPAHLSVIKKPNIISMLKQSGGDLVLNIKGPAINTHGARFVKTFASYEYLISQHLQ